MRKIGPGKPFPYRESSKPLSFSNYGNFYAALDLDSKAFRGLEFIVLENKNIKLSL